MLQTRMNIFLGPSGQVVAPIIALRGGKDEAVVCSVINSNVINGVYHNVQATFDH